MARYSYLRNGRVLLVSTTQSPALERALLVGALAFMGLAVMPLVFGFVGFASLLLTLGGLILLGLIHDTVIRIARDGDLRVQQTLFGRVPVCWRSFAAGTWKLAVVPTAEGIGGPSWRFVIQGHDGALAAPYSFSGREGALRLRQRILAFVADSPF